MQGEQPKIFLASIAFALFSIIVVSLFWLATTPEQGVSILLSYAAGLSMIFLPCTFPLVFVIVPLTVGKQPYKGLLMALLFGLGVTITITVYAVSIAFVGQFLGLDQITKLMFAIAGFAALAFGLSELKLVNFNVPGFAGIGTPMFIRKQKDYLKAFFLGLFLGNAGIGCPNPAFYVLLLYIASLGDLLNGGLLGLVHGIGRATPLIFLALLGILGINATKAISSRIESINKIVGFSLLFFGAFLFTFGLHGMHWWEDSIFHATWNQAVLDIAPALAEKPDHPVAPGIIQSPLWLGWATFLALFFVPTLYHQWKNNARKTRLLLITAIFFILLAMAATGFLTAIEPHGHIR